MGPGRVQFWAAVDEAAGEFLEVFVGGCFHFSWVNTQD